MKIINKTMDYEKVMALPSKPRKKPKKVNIFFRTLMKTLFTGWGCVSISASLEALGMSTVSLVTVILSVIVLGQLDNQINTRPDLDNSALPISPSRSLVYVSLCWTVAIAWIILLASNTESAFIYFQF